MHVCFLLITYVNGIATCSVACTQKQVRTSATQYSIISLPQTIQSLSDRINFEVYIASCKQTLDQVDGFNTQYSTKHECINANYVWTYTYSVLKVMELSKMCYLFSAHYY